MQLAPCWQQQISKEKPKTKGNILHPLKDIYMNDLNAVRRNSVE